jgi:RNA polymerase sigma factor (TIGR02999 family)
VSGSHHVTELLHQMTGGSDEAAGELYSLIYEELQRIARAHLSRENPAHRLQTTELVHEAYLRLVDQRRSGWTGQVHFLSVASRAMRRILVDHARARDSLKRGGGRQVNLSLDEALNVAGEPGDEALLALDRALDRLAGEEPEKARVVEMHFFGGLTHDECARVMGVSARTVYRHWEYARAWLYREIATPSPGG